MAFAYECKLLQHKEADSATNLDIFQGRNSGNVERVFASAGYALTEHRNFLQSHHRQRLPIGIMATAAETSVYDHNLLQQFLGVLHRHRKI